MKHQTQMPARKKTLSELIPTLRSDGRYTLSLSIGNSRVSVYGDTSEKCLENAGIKLGLDGPKVRPGSISEFVVLHYLAWQKPRVELDTFRRYEDVWMGIVGPSFGTLLFSELSETNVQSGLLYGDYKASSRQLAKTVLKAIVQLAIAQGKCPLNVPTMIAIAELPSKEPKEREDMGDKAAALLKAAEEMGHWAEGFVYAAQTLGLRKGELCAIKKGDFDTEKGTLTVRRQRNHTAGERDKLKKRKKGQVRKIGLPPAIMERLLTYFRPNAIYLVTREDGSPPPTNHFHDYLKPIEERAGFHVTPHDMRSAAICNLIDAGADDRAIMDLVGHGSREMIDHYRDLKTSRTRDALAKLGSQNT